MSAYTPTYWNHNGKHQEAYDRLWKELVPASGPSNSPAGELLRAISKIYHDYYNNGFGNGPFREQWELLRSYWSYVRQYVSNPKSPKIFADAFASTNYGGRMTGDDEDDFYEGDDEYESYRSAGPAEFGPDAEEAMDDIVDAVVQIAEKIYQQEQEAAPERATTGAATMRRRAADDNYEAVVDNADTGPGKFEGEGAVGKWVYEQSLDGWGEEMGDVDVGIGHYTMLSWDKPILVRDSDGTEWTFKAVIIHEGSQGFVDPTYYDTAEEAEAVWADLEQEIAEDEEGEEGEEAPSQEDINEAINIDQEGDFMVAYYERREIVRAEGEGDFWAELQLWAKKQNYTPDIYSVNDHGNVTAYDYRGNVVGEWV